MWWIRRWARTSELARIAREVWGWSVAVLAVLAVAGSWGCDRRVEPAAAVAETTDPAQKLQQMSDALAHARQFTFKATRQLDASLIEGSNLAESSEIEVSISRPNMIRATMSSPQGGRRFYADGRSISLLDERMKLYATVPLSGTIDDVADALDQQYGFTPPLAEFVSNDPYKKFSTQVQNSAYLGKETVAGADCDHLRLTGEIADAELWISVTDQLPRKFVATFKDREGSPQLKIDFSEWNLAAKVEDSAFTFDPPQDAQKIVMVSVEDATRNQDKAGKP